MPIPAAGAKPAPAEQVNLAAGKHEANQELADAGIATGRPRPARMASGNIGCLDGSLDRQSRFAVHLDGGRQRGTVVRESIGRARARAAAATRRQKPRQGAETRGISRPELLYLADPGGRASLMAALQRSVGNRAVVELVTTARAVATPTTAAGGAPSIRLHGETSGTYDGGQSAITNRKVRRATGCDCPADQPCVRATGTLAITYHVDVTIRMPDMPDGLTPCQQRRVRTFLRDVLRPHEEDHARRLRTYNGTTRRPFDLTGCGTDAVQERLQEMHDTEAEQRATAADARSAAIDPFERDMDLDCE